MESKTGLMLCFLMLSYLLPSNFMPVRANSVPNIASAPIFTAQAQLGLPAAVQWMNQGLQSLQQGKVADAIIAFRQASQLDPDLAAAHYNLGLALRQQGQIQLAADAFYRAT